MAERRSQQVAPRVVTFASHRKKELKGVASCFQLERKCRRGIVQIFGSRAKRRRASGVPRRKSWFVSRSKKCVGMRPDAPEKPTASAQRRRGKQIIV